MELKSDGQKRSRIGVTIPLLPLLLQVSALVWNIQQSVALVAPPSSLSASNNNKAATLPLIQVERMTAQEYRQKRQEQGPLALDRPILISDALDPNECEKICDAWIQAVGSERITVQRKRPQQPIKLYECTVAQSLDLMMDHSSQEDSMFAFVEGLLDASSPLSQRLTAAREALFPDLKDRNWFDFFPKTVQPSDCVVLAGEGATSTLHRDPFEWTGTSLCLEGRKIWRFLAPMKDNDDGTNINRWEELLQSYRLKSTAWSSPEGGSEHTSDSDNEGEINDEMVLSAGWQSDLTLYTPATKATTLQSARELAELSDKDAETYLEELASTTSLLDFHEAIAIQDDAQGAATTPKMGVNCCSVVQHPGELLLIPPYWYHQTYAAEPSLAVASQRCGSLLDAARVVGHILTLQQEQSFKNVSSTSSSLPSLPFPDPLQRILDGKIDPATVDPEAHVTLLFDYLQDRQRQSR